jgi:hypothetical protein
MPALETYSEPRGSDLLTALSLWPDRLGGLFKFGRVQTDITPVRLPLRTNPISQEIAQVQQDWGDAGAPTVPSNFIIQAIEQHYVFKDRDEVIGFIKNRPFLIPILTEAYSKIGSYFPESPQVFLEVVTDPEVPDDTQLVASVKTNLSPDEALERLDSFDREWWLQSMDRAKGELCIDVEFL